MKMRLGKGNTDTGNLKLEAFEKHLHAIKDMGKGKKKKESEAHPETLTARKLAMVRPERLFAGFTLAGSPSAPLETSGVQTITPDAMLFQLNTTQCEER
jgi:hypothetical protein